MVIRSNFHEYCSCNYEGSLGSMEISGMLWMTKRLHTFMDGCVYYGYIVSDDDTSMRNYLTHPNISPAYRKHIGGYLPKEILVPEWFSDPDHRIKCVYRGIF